MDAHSLLSARWLAAVGALAVMLAGCADSTQPLAWAPPNPPPEAEFPAVSGSADVYDRESPTRFAARSRYVLHDDGTFELQELRWVSGSERYFAYPGEYVRADAEFDFGFAEDSRWKATGTLEGTRLRIEYNLIMALSDIFDDGVYIRSEGSATSP